MKTAKRTYQYWKYPLIGLLALAVIFSAVFFLRNNENTAAEEAIAEIFQSEATREEVAAISQYQYVEEYSHPEYRFSFKHPEDFSVTVVPSAEEEIVLIQNANKKIGIQILVTPFGEDMDLTVDIVRADLPDVVIEDAEVVEIGEGRKGVAFLSDNPQFGGASREVWFVFNNNLYQISTYAKYDEFLKGLFSTWQFNT